MLADKKTTERDRNPNFWPVDRLYPNFQNARKWFRPNTPQISEV